MRSTPRTRKSRVSTAAAAAAVAATRKTRERVTRKSITKEASKVAAAKTPSSSSSAASTPTTATTATEKKAAAAQKSERPTSPVPPSESQPAAAPPKPILSPSSPSSDAAEEEPTLEKIVAACERGGEIMLFIRQENSEEIYTDSIKNIAEKWPNLLLQFYDKYITFDSSIKKGGNANASAIGSPSVNGKTRASAQKKKKTTTTSTQALQEEEEEDSVFRVLGANEINGEKFFLVCRKDTSETVIVNQKVAYKKYPELVVKFYEEHLTWEDIG